ncbi:MAG: hypothetical protein ABIW82_17375 [Dokdonella sp.]
MGITARDVQGIISKQLRPGESMLEQAMWRSLEERIGSTISLEQARSALGDAEQFGWIERVGDRIRRPLT